ncbi:hypothetical protein ACSFB7_24385 [Variovorax sp. GB1P17]
MRGRGCAAAFFDGRVVLGDNLSAHAIDADHGAAMAARMTPETH